MKFHVAVLSWRKPEFLYHCLWHLTSSIDLGSITVFQDNGMFGPPSEDENQLVASVFGVKLARFKHNHRRRGVTFNAWSALREFLETDASHVLLCEEDVLMSPDWIRLHTSEHQANPWCCMSLVEKGFDAKFNAIGVSFSRSVVEEIVKLKFPRPFDATLWHHVVDQGLVTTATERSTAWHVGWYGYNTGNNEIAPTGSLADKINFIRRLIDGEYNPRVEVANKPLTWSGIDKEWKPVSF